MKAAEKAVLSLFGSFNPPTLGHLAACRLAKNFMRHEGFNVIKTLLVPVHSGYEKKGLLPSRDRVEMCEALCQTTNFLDVELYEVNKPTYTPTIITLRYLRKKYKAHPFIICGSDLVKSFNDRHAWTYDEVYEILEDYGLCILPRGKEPLDPTELCSLIKGREKNVHVLKFNPYRDVSSTNVRNEISHGETPHNISKAVYKIIEKKHLYSNN